jgi:hypothetical protein
MGHWHDNVRRLKPTTGLLRTTQCLARWLRSGAAGKLSPRLPEQLDRQLELFHGD